MSFMKKFNKSIYLEDETIAFVKNIAISCIPFIGGGIVGAELSDLVSDDGKIISLVSTVSQYIAAYPVFMALYAYDNKDHYIDNGKWNKKRIMIDAVRVIFALAIAEVAYILGRTGLMNVFLIRNYNPSIASVMADIISIPLYICIAVPLAKKFNLIKIKN